MTDSIARFFNSFDFYKGFALSMAILIVISLSVYFDHFETGLSLTMGMMICAPADVPGSTRHRVIGILIATLLGIVVTIIVSFASPRLWLLVPVVAVLVFLISYISVYGFRASLVSFAGLFALVLSFAHQKTGSDIFVHAGLMGVGGLWYLLFSHLLLLLSHKRHTAQLMAECMALTARYLQTRAALALNTGDKHDLQNELFTLQTDINARHEILREILLSSRRSSGQSNFSRRQVLILIELIDILELAMANLPNLRNMYKIVAKHKGKVKPFRDLITEMAAQLDDLSKVMGGGNPDRESRSLDALLAAAENNIARYREENNLPATDEDVLLLQQTFQYIEKQAQKIRVIQKVLNNLLEKDQMRLKSKYSAKFITQQDYDWKIFTENLSLKSPIFRHSLRLTLTVLAGLMIGIAVAAQNSYWIILTTIVIMRPSYGLTKQRSKNRTYGTLIGGAIAVGIVFLTQNPYVYSVLAVITFILAFSLVQKNYKSSAIFITLNVVFIYALIQPDVLRVIQFRVLDTVTGAALAAIANIFFWPSWEFQNIQTFIGETINANRRYLLEIDHYYHHKNNADPSYKLSRKDAFLAIGNLNAAFQRMMQEPKSRQKNATKIYEVVVLNHTFLSLIAALGTYMRSHQTTKPSRHFETYIANICYNLEEAFHLLNGEPPPENKPAATIEEARQYLDTRYSELKDREDLETADQLSYMQELILISDQLKWLYTLSENLKNIVRTL